jgi:hypothetical protein
MLVPIPRGLAESLDPIQRPIAHDPDLELGYRRWAESRLQFIGDLNQPGTEAARRGWQKHYFKGQTPAGERAEGHQTRLNLKEFREPNP